MSYPDSNPEPRPSHIIDPQTGEPSPLLAERPWLEERSREELIDFIIELAEELRARPAGQTSTNIPIVNPPLDQIDATHAIDIRSTQFQRIPNRPRSAHQPRFVWRIILKRIDGQHLPIAVEIVDDAIAGRSSEALNVDLDLDLTSLGADELGVSRLHCLLRPTQQALLLFDLGSSNGTSVNGALCTTDRPQIVEDNAVIRLGAMFLRVHILAQP